MSTQRIYVGCLVDDFEKLDVAATAPPTLESIPLSASVLKHSSICLFIFISKEINKQKQNKINNLSLEWTTTTMTQNFSSLQQIVNDFFLY